MKSFEQKDENLENEQNQQSKTQKKQKKIIDKLTQRTEEYFSQSQGGISSSKSLAQISNNQLRKHQINRLVEECQKMKNIKEIPSEQVLKMVKTYDMLFAAQSKQVTLKEQNIQIIDIKLRVHNEFEDYLYSQHQLIHNTFRRGLCLLLLDNEYSILRKGLKKFFDINLKQFCNKANSTLTNKTEEIIHNYTFSCLPKESEIKITQMEKVNGENAQISYNRALDRWIIGSKNVTLLCIDESELNQYDSQITNDPLDNRYRYAMKIAQEWFKIIGLSKNVDSIKNYLNDHTLIGEYCGNNEYQHFVQYDHVQLKFYALVPKVSAQSSVNCLHPDQTLAILQSLELNTVKFNHIITKNYEDFEKQLLDIIKTVSISKLSEVGEGNVLYFSDSQQECFSLAKLKSLECNRLLRILDRFKRKIREKLRLILTKDQDSNATLNKYIDEVTSLAKELNQLFEHPIQIDLNIDLAKKCFEATQIELIQKKDADFKNFCVDMIDNKFISFLTEIEQKDKKENVFELEFQKHNII
ncbi:unnamed protein product (macronuclear) [Paramecium tetraurelia]|uniref:RNA ligase domain-containing protein n=1 Tax=Paramecium tetraurelia TaxID=5888 RepID=A0DUB4_PARTE|nr:uncharacterized protein GSPATT00020303001 [Paramecium tetraurelia]CAK86631.1 unnamed protein product [Paramecium tetraurelia]|eukprot:XP_001454028.1 hypothetical protein (macronuclear) [Paramecium tetraurelia strain d4-2]